MGVSLNPNARYTHTIATDLVLPVSYCGWVRVDTDRNNFTTICWLGDDASTDHCVLLALQADGVTPILYDNNFDSDVTGTAMTVGTWYFVAATATSAAGGLRLYQVAQGGTLALTDSSTYTGAFDGELIGIGGGRPDGESAAVNADASFACWRFWTAELTLSELQAEQASATPVRTANLWSSYRLLDAATATTDGSGNGRNLTATAGTGSFVDTADPFSVTVVAALAETDSLAAATHTTSRTAQLLAETDGLSQAARSSSAAVPALGEVDALTPAAQAHSAAASSLTETDALLTAEATHALAVAELGDTEAFLSAARASSKQTGTWLETDVLHALDVLAPAVDINVAFGSPRLRTTVTLASPRSGTAAGDTRGRWQTGNPRTAVTVGAPRTDRSN